MYHRWSKHILMLVIVSGYLFSLVGLPGVSVLCYGQSGHLAVETYGTNCTVADSAVAAADADQDRHALAAQESDESGCVDILIQTESAPPRNAAAGHELTMLAAMHAVMPELLLALPMALSTPMRGAHDQILPSFNDTQRALRSVILLV